MLDSEGHTAIASLAVLSLTDIKAMGSRDDKGAHCAYVHVLMLILTKCRPRGLQSRRVLSSLQVKLECSTKSSYSYQILMMIHNGCNLQLH